jgi:hypothetical protein
MRFEFSIKLMLSSFFLISMSFCSRAQTTADPYPFASDLIKFDVVTARTDKQLPFDKPFVLAVENVATGNITGVYLYRVKYKQGNRQLYPDDKQTSYADYVFRSNEIIKEKNKLSLLVPALKPGKDFDILIEGSLSGRNIDKALALNKLIKQNSYSGGKPWPNDVRDAYVILRDSANNNQFTPPRDVFTLQDPSEYYTSVYLPAKTDYEALTDDSKLKSTVSFFTPAEISGIVDKAPNLRKTFNDAYLLEHISKEGSFTNLLLGLTNPSAPHNAKLDERAEFDKRIANLSASISFFDSLYQSLNELAAHDPAYQTLRDRSLVILSALQSNRNTLHDYLKKVTDAISKYSEAVWLIGTTNSKDLQTKSSSLFTVDFGMANIGMRDLDNKIVYIPKLYWGLNIYFRGVDKNIPSRYFKKKRDKETVNGNVIDYDVLSHKTPFNRLCLTLGFTFGSVDKANFDNFFAGSSMLIGPSLRLSRSFRIGGGLALMKRTSSDPLKADKDIATGAFASLSLDIDILSAAKNVTNLFFK